jgi:hypothetical protein
MTTKERRKERRRPDTTRHDRHSTHALRLTLRLTLLMLLLLVVVVVVVESVW